jgi:1-phosphofructokinase family hexose kinase
MIFTLTPNPSVDRSVNVPEIRFNAVLRSRKIRLDWGGKGFNVSRSLQQFGIESIVLAWVGGGSGKMLADGLQHLGIQTDFVWVDEDTRTNTMIFENQGDWHVKVNEPGPSISSDAIEQMILKVEGYAKNGDIWILSGSLPPDVPEDVYANLIRVLKSHGAQGYLDANGAALRYGCQAVPFLVKPNVVEASKVVGFTIDDQEDAKRAALPFLRMGIDIFALTLNTVDLLIASQHEMVFAASPRVTVRNATGAGDSLMAGMIYAQTKGMDLIEVARWAVATGAASVESEGVSEFDINRVQELLSSVDSKIINVL